MYSCKVPAILVRFYSKLASVDRFSKNTKISSSIKICPVGAELFHANGRTDMTTLTVAFHDFSRAPLHYQLSANEQHTTTNTLLGVKNGRFLLQNQEF